MDTDLPRITVVTPSYNQGAFLERTIQSVLNQEYPNLEYFVMDGGSTDGSVDIIRRYADRIDHWVSQPDGGQAAAINGGWRQGSGEILCWLNSDDYYLPETLAFVGDFFRTHPAAWVVYGSCLRVDVAGHRNGYLGSRFSRRALLYSRQVIPQPSAFFHRRAVDSGGPLDESLRYSFDYDFLLRVAERGAITYVSRPLAAFTVHPGAKTTKERSLAKHETQLVRRRHARGIGQLIIRLQPAASSAYQALPDAVRHSLGRLRPRRIFRSPPPA